MIQTIAIQNQIRKIAFESLLIFLFSSLLALFSRLAIPLPFTPIPMTLQTLAIFIIAGTLGSRLGIYSILAYLLEGSLGLPVFAGGIANPLWLLDCKAGFLLSFIVAVFLIGKLLERKKKPSTLYIALCLILGQIVIFTIGAIWLSFFVGISKAFLFGVLPFLSGALIKILSATLIIRAYHVRKI